MPTPSLYQKSLAQIYKLYSHDVGKVLVHMGTMGWFFSSLAQVTMIATNKNIDKKEKKFLIPQEIADGAINVGLFFTISKFIKDYADNLVESGKISLETTEKILAKFRNDNQTKYNYAKGIADKYVDIVKDSNMDKLAKKDVLNRHNQYTSLFYERAISELEELSKCKVIKNAKKSHNIIALKPDKELLNLVKKGQKEFLGFKNGVGVIAAVGASVLASNIITPVCRNIVANKFQDNCKKRQEKKPVYDYTSLNPVFNVQPNTTTFGAFRI